jgi:hypothetical protein
MTDEIMSLRTLLEKSADADLLREMVGFAAQRLMELEVENLTGAAHCERSPTATAIAIGRPELAPSSCAFPSEEGSYFPAFLEPRRMAEGSPNFPWRGFRVRILSTPAQSQERTVGDALGARGPSGTTLCHVQPDLAPLVDEPSSDVFEGLVDIAVQQLETETLRSGLFQETPRLHS